MQNNTKVILAEKRPVPFVLKDKRLVTVFFCAHRGNSMQPTLSERDLLEIEPYGRRPMRRGDVIFFTHPQEDKPAVHRVMRISSEGILTRGDNNNLMDPWVLRAEDVIGRVVRARQGKEAARVWRDCWKPLVLRCREILNGGKRFLLFLPSGGAIGVFQSSCATSEANAHCRFASKGRKSISVALGKLVDRQLPTRNALLADPTSFSALHRCRIPTQVILA